ncbi:MAG: hypothetical protein ACKVJ1_09975, partial [Verrucomicrobiia bacterium]
QNQTIRPVLSPQNQSVKNLLLVFVVLSVKKRRPRSFFANEFDLIAQNILKESPYGVFFALKYSYYFACLEETT